MPRTTKKSKRLPKVQRPSESGLKLHLRSFSPFNETSAASEQDKPSVVDEDVARLAERLNASPSSEVPHEPKFVADEPPLSERVRRRYVRAFDRLDAKLTKATDRARTYSAQVEHLRAQERAIQRRLHPEYEAPRGNSFRLYFHQWNADGTVSPKRETFLDSYRVRRVEDIVIKAPVESGGSLTLVCHAGVRFPRGKFDLEVHLLSPTNATIVFAVYTFLDASVAYSQVTHLDYVTADTAEERLRIEYRVGFRKTSKI